MTERQDHSCRYLAFLLHFGAQPYSWSHTGEILSSKYPGPKVFHALVLMNSEMHLQTCSQSWQKCPGRLHLWFLPTSSNRCSSLTHAILSYSSPSIKTFEEFLPGVGFSEAGLPNKLMQHQHSCKPYLYADISESLYVYLSTGLDILLYLNSQ